MDITLTHYLVVDSCLFMIGIVGIFLNYRNLLILLMCIELILLAANLNFIAFSHTLNDQTGQIFAFFVIAIAAAEAAVGLAILIVYFRVRGTLEINSEPLMKG